MSLSIDEYYPNLEFPHMVHMRKPVPVYLRFGRWESYSINFHTHEKERGVSVYDAELIDGVVYPAAEWIDEINWLIRPDGPLDGRWVFPVTGKLVDIGSDEEPVLQAVVARPLPVALRVNWV